MNPTRRLLLKLIPASLVAFFCRVPKTQATAAKKPLSLADLDTRIETFNSPAARIVYYGIYRGRCLEAITLVIKNKLDITKSTNITYRLDDREQILSLIRFDLENALTVQECITHRGRLEYLWKNSLSLDFDRDRPLFTAYNAMQHRLRNAELLEKALQQVQLIT